MRPNQRLKLSTPGSKEPLMFVINQVARRNLSAIR